METGTTPVPRHEPPPAQFHGIIPVKTPDGNNSETTKLIFNFTFSSGSLA